MRIFWFVAAVITLMFLVMCCDKGPKHYDIECPEMNYKGVAKSLWRSESGYVSWTDTKTGENYSTNMGCVIQRRYTR